MKTFFKFQGNPAKQQTIKKEDLCKTNCIIHLHKYEKEITL